VTKNELASWAEKRLIHHHYLASGEDPQQGSYTPKEDTLDALQKLLLSHGETDLDEFFSDSIRAHLHKTRSTNTPFFVNTMLLSRSSLEYLETFKGTSAYFASKSFEDNLKQDLAQNEQDFLRTILVTTVGKSRYNWVDSFAPAPWWVACGEILGRFTKKDLPGWWFESRPIYRGGLVVDFKDEFPAVRKRVSKETKIKVLLESLFEPIAVTSSMHFLSGLGLLFYTKDAFKRQVITSTKLCEGSIPKVTKLCRHRIPLVDRDMEMVREISKHITPPDLKTKTKRPVSIKEEDLSSMVKLMLVETESD